MRKPIIALLPVVALWPIAACAAPPPPDLYADGISRVELIEVLAGYGMSASDATVRESDPWIQAQTAKGVAFYVNMYECTGTGPKSRRCALIQFQAQWQNNAKIKEAAVNAYNVKFVFGRAALSEDGQTLLFDYPLNIKDGVTKANLKRNIDNWLRVLDDVRATFKAF
jgi:hypothetical protein